MKFETKQILCQFVVGSTGAKFHLSTILVFVTVRL